MTVQNERLPPSSPLQHTNQIRAFGCLLEEIRLAPEVLQHWLEVFVAFLLAAQYLVHINARIQRVDTLPLHQFRAEVYDLALRRIDKSENPLLLRSRDQHRSSHHVSGICCRRFISAKHEIAPWRMSYSSTY